MMPLATTLLAGLLALPQAAQTAPASAPAPTSDFPPLEVAWRVTAPGRIEVFEVVGAGASAALLATCSDGQVAAYDVDTGRARWPAPIRLPPGVKWAGAIADVAFLYDCHRVYALRVAPAVHEAPSPRLWSIGAAPADANDPYSEPEVRRCLAAARAAPQGVLTAAVDGRLALLDLDTGEVLWTVRLNLSEAGTPAAQMEIELAPGRAAVLYQARGVIRAVWLPLERQGARELASRPLPDWPLFASLGPTGLFVLTSDLAALLRPDGEVWREPMGAGVRPIQRSVTLVNWAAVGDAAAIQQEVWFCTREGDLYRQAIPSLPPPPPERVLRADQRRCRSILAQATGVLAVTGGTDLTLVSRERGALFHTYAVAPNLSWVAGHATPDDLVVWGVAPAGPGRPETTAYVGLLPIPDTSASAAPELLRLYRVPDDAAAAHGDARGGARHALERTRLHGRLMLGAADARLVALRLPPPP